MKKLFLLLPLLLLSCTELSQCNYKVAVTYENESIDTLKFLVISDYHEVRLKEGRLHLGNNILYNDSIVSFTVIEKTCKTLTDSLKINP